MYTIHMFNLIYNIMILYHSPCVVETRVAISDKSHVPLIVNLSF
jgi:hypothetical protein